VTRGRGAFVPVIISHNSGQNFGAKSKPRGNVLAASELQLINRGYVLRLGHRNNHPGLIHVNGQNVQAHRHGLGNGLQD